MIVLNARNSGLNIPLNNQITKVPAYSESIPFIGTESVVRAIITLGSPRDLGLVVQTSFEYDVMQKIPEAIPYMYNSVSEARVKLLEGKEPEPTKDARELGVNVEVDKLKAELKLKMDEIKAKEAEIAELRDQIANSPIEKYKEELDNLRKDYLEVKKIKDSVESENSNLTNELNNLKLRHEALNKEYQGVLKVNEEQGNALMEAKKTLDELKSSEGASEELKAENEKLTSENAELKSEGQKLMENYDKMRSALKNLCQLTGYSMVDGQWIKQE